MIRDQDAADCREVKRALAQRCAAAGRPDALVRVACRELESRYFGDLGAVERGLGLTGLASLQGKRKYKVPDQIRQPSRELAKITRNRYRKVAGSRAIGPELSLTGNRSPSFRVFRDGVRDLAGI